MEKTEQGELLFQIITGLEEHGLSRDCYCLYDVVDPDALSQLISSTELDLTVQFLIHQYRVTVTGDGDVEITLSDT